MNINEINKNGRSRLTQAIQDSDMTYSRNLIERGADIDLVDDLGWSPLSTAILNNSITAVKMLIDAGVDVEMTNLINAQEEDLTALDLAIKSNNKAIIKLLS